MFHFGSKSGHVPKNWTFRHHTHYWRQMELMTSGLPTPEELAPEGTDRTLSSSTYNGRTRDNSGELFSLQSFSPEAEVEPRGILKTNVKVTRTVMVRALVHRLLDVNLVLQQFTVKSQIEASWFEPELKPLTSKSTTTTTTLADVEAARSIAIDRSRTNQYVGHLYCYLPSEKEEDNIEAEKSAKRFWAPRLYFDNVLTMENEESWYHFYDSSPGEASNPPMVCLHWSFTGTYSEPMELSSFPLDVQTLTMRLVSGHEEVRAANSSIEKRTIVQRGAKVRAKQVELVKNASSKHQSNLRTRTFLQAHEYTLYPRFNFQTGETREEDSSSASVYAADGL